MNTEQGAEGRQRRRTLLPTSMTTMFGSAWSLSSFNHLSTFSKVTCLEMSYTNRAPTAPLRQYIHPMSANRSVMTSQRAPVICAGDGAVPLLACGVPYLSYATDSDE